MELAICGPSEVVRRLRSGDHHYSQTMCHLPLPTQHPVSRARLPRASESARTVYIVVRGALGCMAVDSSRRHFLMRQPRSVLQRKLIFRTSIQVAR